MHFIKLCLLLVFLSACALEPASTIGEIELTVVMNTPEPELPTFTPEPPASATFVIITPSPTAQAAISHNCTARTDLPTYTVVSGDSLSSIAARTGSTVPQLAEWNCLTNTNMIVVGMRLQVAREALPATLTPTPTRLASLTPSPTAIIGAPLVFGPMGALSAYPVIEAGNPSNWTDFIIETGIPITFYWSGIDPEYYVHVGQIEFFYTPDGANPISIGIDSDKSDGMTVTWTAPAEVSGRITARAQYGTNGTIDSPAIHLRPR